MSEKLIVPSEVKVCATCSYWDGPRRVDEEVQVVVVDHDCQGECLVQETLRPATYGTKDDAHCIWEDLSPDDPAQVEAGGS